MKKSKIALSVLLIITSIYFMACSNASDGSDSKKEEEQKPVPTYTVTYVDGVDGLDISVPSDTNQYHEGDTVTVKFSDVGERSGYNFTGWSNGTNTFTSNGTKTFKMGSADVMLTAQWISAVTPTYTITIADNISNGTVTASKTSAAAGEIIKLEANAVGKYMLDSWNVTDADGAGITVTNNCFVMPEKNVIVSASFAEYYSITYVDGVDGIDIIVPDVTLYREGETVIINFTEIGERSDYMFIGWSDGTNTFNSNGTTTFTMKTEDVILTAQWVWKYDFIGNKAPSEAKSVGDIVFNDGSAIPYKTFEVLETTEKETKRENAIAIIFYKGSDLNSGDDITTVRTLGVGLKHNKTRLTWCNNTSDAYKKKITSVLCISSRDDSGTWTFTGDKNGRDNLEQIEAFDGINDTTGDGANERYKAFYFAKNYSTFATNLGENYKDGWYLPSAPELYQIYLCRTDTTKGFDIDAASELCHGDKFGKNNYWTSSQTNLNNTSAYVVGFDGTLYNNDKSSNGGGWQFNTCCIRQF